MELREARILVSNDDGINAPGIKVLEKIAKTLSDDVWVVAPESEQSASGHSLTLTLPLRVRRISRRKFAVNGTPTDSVLLAVQNIIKGKRPDLVLSGVNAGGNLGIVEEHFVEITEPVEEKDILGQRSPYGLILGHHRSEFLFACCHYWRE